MKKCDTLTQEEKELINKTKTLDGRTHPCFPMNGSNDNDYMIRVKIENI